MKATQDYNFIFSKPPDSVPDPVRARFADGERMIPTWIVNSFGGPEKMRERVPELQGIKFTDFVRACQNHLSRKQLAAITKQYVRNALKRR